MFGTCPQNDSEEKFTTEHTAVDSHPTSYHVVCALGPAMSGQTTHPCVSMEAAFMKAYLKQGIFYLNHDDFQVNLHEVHVEK